MYPDSWANTFFLYVPPVHLKTPTTLLVATYNECKRIGKKKQEVKEGQGEEGDEEKRKERQSDITRLDGNFG